jgi:Ca-activated chloride channel family protein
MELKWPWLAALLMGVVLALLFLWLRRPSRPHDSLLVAHSNRLRQLPRYRWLARRQMVITALRTAGALVLIAGAILLASRPIRVEVAEPDRSARDIQLCLDVSPSMYDWNLQIVEEFRELVKQLSGERIGLTIFNASSVTVFPLTDDYEFMADRLNEAEDAFRTREYQYFVGTLPLRRIGDQLVPDPSSASQIGDGLASCLQRFDPTAEARGRAVVLASDNDPLGRPLFSLEEAVGQALRDNVVVYGIGPPDLAEKPERASGFDAAATATGGTLALLQEETNVDDVVAGIQRLERSRLEQAPRATELDDPEVAFAIACAGFALLIGATLVGRRS